jgi:DNA polymerase-3 subunit epsilon
MFAIIDFETTGLTDEKSTDFMRQPGIVQLAVKILKPDFTEHNKWDTLVNPDIAAGAWAEAAIETHGITPEMVQSAPSFMELHPKLAGMVNGSQYWVGYRSRFDRDVLWYQLMRYGLERNFPWPPFEIDVMKHANTYVNQKGRKGTKFITLQDAHTEIIGKPFEGAHDAMADVDATAAVLRTLALDKGYVF